MGHSFLVVVVTILVVVEVVTVLFVVGVVTVLNVVGVGEILAEVEFDANNVENSQFPP